MGVSPLDPVGKLIDAILVAAVSKRARAIRLIQERDQIRVYFEVDRQWQIEVQPPRRLRDAIASRMASLAGIPQFTPGASGQFDVMIGVDRYRADLELWVGDAVFRIELRPALTLE